jgi:Putative phage tail protein
MATLVLTAVGTALGGPLGGALGAMLGQSADALLFAPKARQGPRLSDLKVQTSSYGDAIPELFGTMRVAGTVIWATDLQERRQKKSAGKGRPAQVEYSYSASFAVALSARPIGAIRRIWADGKLLRDASGSFAEAVSFRSYRGDADQKADPLIASAVGIERASAFRGLAYAMFEALDLSAFGNRIPQLSFEVEADAQPVAAAAIGGELLSDVTASGGPALTGYAAGGGRVREALAPLAAFADLAMQSVDGASVLAWPHWPGGAMGSTAAAQVHGAATLRAEEDRRTPLDKMPEQILLRHFDPARDYQTSQQGADVAGGRGPVRMIELPGALAAGAAQGQARVLARAAGQARRGVRVRGGLGALTLPLGRVLGFDLAGESGLWRIAERQIGADGVSLLLIRHGAAPVVTASAGDGGDALVAGAVPGFAAMVTAFDVPSDGEVPLSAPLRLIAGGGLQPGWRGADLWWVGSGVGEPEPIGRISDAAALGVLDAPLGPAASWLIDWTQPVVVRLAHAGMTLENIPEAALVAGGNLAMIGGEAVQFLRATPLGERRWRLEGLLRGRGGAEAPPSGHSVATPFVLLGDPALLALPDALALQAGSQTVAIDWQARGSAEMQRLELAPAQQALLPLAPVHGQTERLANGDTRVRWIARSRAGARWRDGVEVPVGEAAASWRAAWTNVAGEPVAVDVGAPEVVLEAGSHAPLAVIQIVQRGDHGVSPPLAVALPV